MIQVFKKSRQPCWFSMTYLSYGDLVFYTKLGNISIDDDLQAQPPVRYVRGKKVRGGPHKLQLSLGKCNDDIYSRQFCILQAQSRQSAKLFPQSSELGLPQLLTRRQVCPPAPSSGERVTLAGKRGVGRVPIPTKEHCGTLYIYVRCALQYYRSD